MSDAPPANPIQKVAFLGDYAPRQCGIATFTTDLCRAVSAAAPGLQALVAPVNDIEGGYAYPPEARFEIDEQDIASYQRAADFLNISNSDVLCVQHEYGIYGGPAGSHLLALLREVKMPVVTTLHTLLREPSPDQRRVMDELLQLSTRLVVMTERTRTMLHELHQAPLARIDLIPHGIPDTPFVDANFYKDQFGVEGKQVLLTFGLLSPNKGIEQVLKALPAIIAEFPAVVYIVLGATHPNLVRDQGEAYRLSLERLAKDLGVQKHVIFYNRFVELEELQEFIGAADIYITPYLHEAQAVSGTLAYAFGAGKAVISTPYWHAAELLADQRGMLVPFGDAAAIATATRELLRDDTRRHSLRKQAYLLGREMVWSNVARLYLRSFQRARLDLSGLGRKRFATKTLDEQLTHLPELKLDHLQQLTDSTGLFQHATFTVPNFVEGYCTDDNARAFILLLWLRERGPDTPRLRALSTTYAAFLNAAFNRESRRFRNFMSFDRAWLERAGSEDSHGRALWALGTCVGRSAVGSLHALAAQLFDQALPATVAFSSPRAWAFALLGIHEYLRRLSGDRFVNQAREQLAERLFALYQANARPDWLWFEDRVTYDNARLAHALILSGRWMNHAAMFDAGLRSLRWLTEIQTAEAGYFRPIGSNGFYQRGGARARFDQQPLEALSLISAALEAFRSTSDSYWFEQACRAFEWFVGRNDLGLALYDAQTGGCRDALHVDRANENQGAESTLAFLLALAELRQTQNMLSSFKRPVQQ